MVIKFFDVAVVFSFSPSFLVCFGGNTGVHKLFIVNFHPLETSDAFNDCQPFIKNRTTYTAASMGVVIILILGALIVMIVLFIRSRLEIRKMLRDIQSKEKMQIYEEVNQAEIIDSLKNVAYEAPSLPQRRRT